MVCGFSIPVWDISSDGYGTAVYSVKGLEREYSLVAFAKYLPADERSDRVIATAWDVTFTLYDGIPDLKEMLIDCVRADYKPMTFKIPYNRSDIVHILKIF